MTAAPRRRILLVEDDAGLRDMLLAVLHAEGFDLVHLDGVRAAREWLTQAHAAGTLPDLIVLDLNLPDGHGGELLRDAPATRTVPTLVISARDEEAGKIALLDAGAEDYLVKPFGVGELLARIRVALRRHAPGAERATPHLYRQGGLEIDLEQHRVQRDGVVLKLTRTEFKILACLAEKPGRVVTHRHLLAEVWGPEYVEHTHYLRVYVGSLRNKLEPNPAQPRYLQTEVGVGYRLSDASEPPG